MVCAGADLALAASANDVSRAVLIGTEERTAAMNLFLLGGLIGIVSRVGALGIAWYAAGGDELLVVVRTIPVSRPLPNVAGHIVEAVRIRRELRNRRDPDVAVVTTVFVGEVPFVSICHPLAVRTEGVAP